MSESVIPEHRESANEPPLYINRELSWLAFNGRVLDQAADPRWPLLERVKFAAIFGSNLDEFFMIRVSGLHEQLESKVDIELPDRLSVAAQLARIGEVVRVQLRECGRLLHQELLPALAEAGVRILSWDDLSADQQRFARDYFRDKVFPVLTPLAVDPAHPFPFLSNLSLSLGVEVENPETQERRFARVKVPESLARFVSLPVEGSAPPEHPPRHDFIALEDLIAANLEQLFAGMTIAGWYPLRVTRDMDLDILEDEAEDLLSVVDRQIRRRRFGAAVRLEVTPSFPTRLRHLLLEKLEMDEADVYESTAPLGLNGLFAIAQLPIPALRDPAFVPRPSPDWDSQDPFAAIRARDILLHHPYESFSPVLEFLAAAADDPDVLAVKMTLYRAGSNAEAVRTLIRAAENGKQVAVSIELKARFDEANNITWARALERAGVHVFYGIAGLKTHAKILLVVRREADGLRRYVHLGTGNYNASTAKLYTDFGLFTADADIGADASEVFNTLSGFSRRSRHRKLVVAPRDLRDTLLAKIEGQTKLARSGKPAAIFAKMNALVDPTIIEKLYAASRAGVQIELCIRGICCLRPGVPGVSESIRVRSVLGRFLEHERVYAFGPREDEEFFLSSADWMPRNLDRRVEVLFPVTSDRLRARLRSECLAPLEGAETQVYEMLPDGSYQRALSGPTSPEHDLQLRIHGAVAGRVARENVKNGAPHSLEL
ncbi:MAG TPA: polyphosphate kinase 1 [Polyangiaceae bacterium]